MAISQETIAMKLELKLESLTPAERKIARVLQANYPASGLDAIARFARSANVSHPTVLRFITKLGFSSYGEFQDALREEVETHFRTLPQRYEKYVQTSPGDGSALDNYADAVRANIDRTYQLTSAMEVTAASKLLAESRGSIFLTGVGLTYPVMYQFFNNLKLARPGVYYITPGAKPYTYLLEMRKKDIVILIQMPRYETDITNFGLEAVNRGADLILFTNDSMSPLAAKATHVFVSPVQVPSPLDSYLGSMLQVELLSLATMNKLGNRYRDRMDALENLVPRREKT
jgi:DNA-binding MurR/RpiR family transcriptional regulator